MDKMRSDIEKKMPDSTRKTDMLAKIDECKKSANGYTVTGSFAGIKDINLLGCIEVKIDAICIKYLEDFYTHLADT